MKQPPSLANTLVLAKWPQGSQGTQTNSSSFITEIIRTNSRFAQRKARKMLKHICIYNGTISLHSC